MIRGMRVLVDANRKLNLRLENEAKNRLYGDQLLLFDNVSSVNERNFSDFKPMLSSLWNDGGIKEAYEKRSQFQVRRQFYTQIAQFSACSFETVEPAPDGNSIILSSLFSSLDFLHFTPPARNRGTGARRKFATFIHRTTFKNPQFSRFFAFFAARSKPRNRRPSEIRWLF